MNNIAILASGSGTNAEAIIRYFDGTPSVRVVCILTNKEHAGVLARAERLNIPSHIFSNKEMKEGTLPLELLNEYKADIVILAGYLNLITEPWLRAYPDRIINIHPALLPNYGGKGMYGHHVHEAVIANKEPFSGITIHLVNEHYDNGRHLLQATCPVWEQDTADTLAARIHTLEHRFFPTTIEQFIQTELPQRD